MADAPLTPLADRFEDSWRNWESDPKTPPPSLDEFLGHATTQRLVALLQLAPIDLEWRLHKDRSARVEDYTRRFPELEQSGGLLSLIETEYSARLGQEPNLEVGEYLRRFPDLATELPACLQRRAAQVAGPLPAGFKYLRRLGQGASGAVYCARQRHPDRVVAIKMLHASGLDDMSRKRFVAEVNAAASLTHDRIVRVYEVGDHEGRPYCVMEYVEGSLADRIGTTPLDPRTAATILAELADAIHFAHQRQIIHRDLKPSNILLTREGIPKVADFGLARRLDASTRLTKNEALLGTPDYMAPEQARGQTDVSIAADIYALGAVLYTCLIGRPPFRTDDYLETLRQVERQEPVPLRRLNSKVPRDLETICLKCLQKEPSRRYASAQDLGVDLRRFLAGQPIQARPTGRLYRGWRWCRQNKLVAGLLAAVVVSLVAGTVVSWSQTLQARAQAAEARRNLRFAARSVQDIVSQITQEKHKNIPGLQPVQRDALKKAREIYGTIAEDQHSDPEVRLELAVVGFQLGMAARTLGDLEQARQAHADAEAVFAQLCARHPELPTAPLERARNYHQLALVSQELVRPDADEMYRQAIALLEQLPKDDPRHSRALARCLGDRARLASSQDRFAEARDGYLQAIALLEETERQFGPAPPDDRRNLALAWNNLARPLSELQDMPKAKSALLKALQLRAALVQEFPEVTAYQIDLAQNHHNLGVWCREFEKDNLPQSVEHFLKAIEVQTRIDYPLQPGIRASRAQTIVNLGATYERSKRPEDAGTNYQRAARELEPLARQFPHNPAYGELLGQVYAVNAGFAARTGQPNLVQEYREKSLELWQRMVKTHPGVPKYQSDLALTHAELGKLAHQEKRQNLAVQHWTIARDMWRELCTRHPRDPQIRLFQKNLRDVENDLGAIGPGKK